MKRVDSIYHFNLDKFVDQHSKGGLKVHSDALPALSPLNVIDQTQNHAGSGTYLQQYLDEFCYRFNRRFIEKQIPNRLLNLAVVHAPVKSA
jgi:hypothetical protein